MILALALLALPLLFWDQGPAGADSLKKAGLERLAVPPEEAAAWREAGFEAVPVSLADLDARTKLPAPRVAAEIQVASPTRRPWIIHNGWQILRNPDSRYLYETPAGKAALAAAEAFLYGIDAVLKIDPDDLESLGKMLGFLRTIEPDSDAGLEPAADFGFVDDGSHIAGEAMNLFIRRNLAFQIVGRDERRFPVHVEIGSAEHPPEAAANPSDFAQRVRQQVGDRNRSFRIFGSEIVIARLARNDTRARLHLLNYSDAKVYGLRFLVQGAYPNVTAKGAGYERLPVQDCVIYDGTTECSLPEMGVYAVVELAEEP